MSDGRERGDGRQDADRVPRGTGPGADLPPPSDDRLRPPALSRRLLVWLAGDRGGLVGDLDEELAAYQQPQRGARGARWWYRRQVVRSVLPLVAGRLRRARSEGRRGRRRGDGMMSELVQDLRYTLRTFRKNAGFTGVILATLTLGIGANTLIYSVVDGLVLDPFPFPDEESLVAVGTQYPRLGATAVDFIEHISPAEYLDIRDQSRTLERVVAWDMGNRQVSFDEITENVFTGFWWGNAFETLEVEPHLGRGITWEESVRGDPVAVLSHRLWTNAFGADESLVGRSIMMNGNPYTVIGIMPPRTVMYGMDLWIPMGLDPSEFPRERRQWQVIGRIAEGNGLPEVNTELEALARRTEQAWVADFEEYEGWRLEADTWTGANVATLRPAAFILLGAVGFVLLLVCTNIASLLLARSATRRQEMALRRAIGAGRGRLVRQVLTESIALALVGGSLGVGLAWLAVGAVGDVLATVPFVSGSVAVDVRVLLFTTTVSVLAGIAFGLIPAIQSAGGGLQAALKTEANGATAHRSRLRMQRVFVGVEVALALVLLAGGGLLLNSVIRMNRVDPGFAAEDVLTMRLTLPWEDYDAPAIDAFFHELEERVSAVPGVDAVGVGSQFPPVAFSFERVAVEGRETLPEGQLPTAMATLASAGYFESLGIPLLRGRGFTDLDAGDAPTVAVVNEAAAALLFPGLDPLGRRMSMGDVPLEVVGVVANTRNLGVDADPFPEVFASLRQVTLANQLFVLVRAAVEPTSLLPAIRAEIRAMDPDQPVYAIRTADVALAQATAPRRIAANVLMVFAGFALILAAVGIFSVVSFSVADRTREIGVRVAIGAAGGEVRWLMVRQALMPVVTGAVFGLVGAVAIGRAIEGFLFGVSGTDLVTLSGVMAVMLGAAVLASWLPARRASRLDPVRALKGE